MQEIERKFLVTDDSYRELAYDKSEILQGYICSGHGHTVRVRTRGEYGYLTIKGPSMDGISRFEWEKRITLQEACDLFTLCRSGRVEKTRYLVRNGKHTIEVDEFHGDNEGLVFAEIELTTVEEEFERPSFLGEEVTGDYHYYNAYISKHPYNTWGEDNRGDEQ